MRLGVLRVKSQATAVHTTKFLLQTYSVTDE